MVATTAPALRPINYIEVISFLGLNFLIINTLGNTNDFMLSKITGYDCEIRRVLKDGIEAICKELKLDKPEEE